MPSSRDGYEEPDAFVQMPPSQTRTIQRLRYMTDPLPEDTLIAGPSALYLYASIDQEDTNWIIILKDVGPDVSVRTAREGETAVPTNLPERELVRGWLKASHRALDPKRSKPWKPWHPFTREAQKPVVPGEINEYAIEILSTANLFEKGHRICIDITSMDVPTGTAGFTNVEYFPYHICSSKTTLHKIYHNEKYPSYLLLPVIPRVIPSDLSVPGALCRRKQGCRAESPLHTNGNQLNCRFVQNFVRFRSCQGRMIPSNRKTFLRRKEVNRLIGHSPKFLEKDGGVIGTASISR